MVRVILTAETDSEFPLAGTITGPDPSGDDERVLVLWDGDDAAVSERASLLQVIHSGHPSYSDSSIFPNAKG